MMANRTMNRSSGEKQHGGAARYGSTSQKVGASNKAVVNKNMQNRKNAQGRTTHYSTVNNAQPKNTQKKNSQRKNVSNNNTYYQNKSKKGQEKLQHHGKEKHIFRWVLLAEIMIIIGLVAFVLGRKVGRDAMQEKLNTAMAAIQTLEQEQASLQALINKQEGAGSSHIYGADNSGTSVEYVEDGNKISEADRIKSEAEKKAAFEKALSDLYDEEPHLILVNKDHKLADDYEVTLKKLYDGTNRASDIAYDALNAMLKKGRGQGLNFEICSSYRSVERQEELLDEDIKALMKKGYSYKDAYEEATRETMPPGYSEHATGLAFDIVAMSYQMLDAHQEKTAECKWLRENCAEYGFILRYPKEKEDITGISYESWHFRYVGEEAAKYIMENKITLEEYLEEYLADKL